MPKAKRTHVSRAEQVGGSTIESLLSLTNADFNRLDATELRNVTTRLASAQNKRVRRMEANDDVPPGVEAMMRGGKFSTAGKNLNRVRSEYAKLQAFFRMKSSSAEGWRDIKQKTRSTLAKHGVKITAKQSKTFWRAYNKLAEVDSAVEDRKYRYKVMRKLSTEMRKNPDKSPDELAVEMEQKAKKIEKQSQKLSEAYKDTDELFERIDEAQQQQRSESDYYKEGF